MSHLFARSEKPIRIAPSVLSADFGRLFAEVQAVESAGADWIHVDVMDGHFVPNITIGPLVVSAIRRATSLPLDVHLMISEPDKYLEAFVSAGASVLTVHAEACTHLQRTCGRIRQLGVEPGVALNPHTSEEAVRYVLDDVSMVLVMTVNPGFGGQGFLPAMVEKIRRLKGLAEGCGKKVAVEVDGGIGPSTARCVVEAGAGILVAGSAVFQCDDYRGAIEAIRSNGLGGVEK